LATTDRYICIHGHFYQPPRENAWLEDVELQDSAYPFHDWNERIASECYAPNGASRILDGQNRIIQIINNYARISFNLGPTLLSWLKEKMPEAYQQVLDADKESQTRFSGHGSAMAQVYNHMIMPLANKRDKYTQVRWGIRDFESRFGHKPEGMWLAETAVDIETLDILAEHGITFTILSHYQAGQVRKIGNDAWQDVKGGRIDPTMCYVQQLPSGRKINLFFYDGPISQAVAFEGLLKKGEFLANRLLGAFSNERTWAQLVHIATDGETYGHHHRYGEMALSYALDYIETQKQAHLTNYGEFLTLQPPTHEVQITENTSWSCYHGIERWRSDCGCNSGGNATWNQAWRKPLREALDWLRDTLVPQYEKKAALLLKDPWAARDAYIQVVLNRSVENIELFLQEHALQELNPSEKITVLKLLEQQRHAMLMYTSCGWFFDEISGIETVQILQYAGRAIQLAEELFGSNIEQDFLERLKLAKSNVPEKQDGAYIYTTTVKPAMIDLQKVAAHYAVSSLFEPYEQKTKVYCYLVEAEDCQTIVSGRMKLRMGQVQITSEITWETARIGFAVIHFGDHNLNGGIYASQDQDPTSYEDVIKLVEKAFFDSDLAELIRLLDRHFAGLTYSLKSLFRDEQRKVLNLILDSSQEQAEGAYRQVYSANAPLMHFLADLHIPLPKSFHTAIEFILNVDLRRAFESEDPDLEQIQALLDEGQRAKIEFDKTMLCRTFERTLNQLMEQLAKDVSNLPLLQKLEDLVGFASKLPFEIDLWRAQNIYYSLMSNYSPANGEQSALIPSPPPDWQTHFTALGEKLYVCVAIPKPN